jgi:HAD superfamily hydrolase (TIGR01490 family)
VKLALFDLDNTLLSGDSDYRWAQFLIARGVLEGERYERENQRFFDQYHAGTLDIREFLDFQLAPLAAYPRDRLDAWHRDFMREQILPIITQPARNLVRRHLEAGDLCAIITATNRFITAPIAREFGVAHLIATEPEEKNGGFTGRFVGTPCFREGKAARAGAWLEAQGLDLAGSFSRSWFYTDSHNDLPLLELVSDPVAVDPDETLLRVARERGWPVNSLRVPQATAASSEFP